MAHIFYPLAVNPDSDNSAGANDDAWNLFNSGNYEEAIPLFEEIIKKDPNNSDAFYNLGLGYYRLGDWLNSIKYYNRSAVIDPRQFDVWYNLGLAYFKNKDYEKALDSYEKALKLKEDHQIWLNKGSAEELLNRREEALESYTRSLKLSPQYAMAWYSKGLLLSTGAAREVREAIECFRKAISYEPNKDEYWYSLGETHIKSAEFKNAIKCFTQALRINPRKRETYERIAYAYESLGLLKEATYYVRVSKIVGKENIDFTVTQSLPELITDLWTSVDELGYNTYANAICKLLLNLSKTPLAISIQAPWGAGKTSLMRIIQAKLDIDRNQQTIELELGKLSYSKIKELKKELETIIRGSDKKNTNDSFHEEQTIELQVKDSKQARSYVTIWLDPWEYENSEQLWAGLADSIIRGILNRMSPIRKELFLLQLNLRIFNLKDLLRWMNSYVLSQIWKKLRPWLFVTAGGLIASGLAIVVGSIQTEAGQFSYPNLSIAGLSGFTVTILQAVINFLRDRNEMENLATGFALSEYLNVPNYSTKLGNMNEAMNDIRRIVRSIPDEYKPVLIFIDDLDRCSTDSIANLFEGVSRFLSTNFEDCIFIIGMDNQVVASSLDVIHESVIQKLPEYLVQSQVGWQYLEKFIQLPILIPPTSKVKFKKYIESLVSTDGVKGVSMMKEKEHTLPFDNQDYQKKVQGIQFSTDIKMLSDAAYIFSNNPRDVKRFLNLVTYYINLCSEIRNIGPRNGLLPTYEQIRRWIILILKWPSLAQWLYWKHDTLSYSISSDVLNSTADKLRLLEQLALESKDQKDWMNKISLELNFNDPGSIPWIVDNSVRVFFRDENNLQEGTRISDGAGLGIY